MAFSIALRRVLVLLAASALLSGCGDDGDGGVPIIDVNAQGRVVLGALGNATLEVYRLGDYAAPVATTTTSTGATLDAIGNFAFSLAEVPANAMFLLVARFGEAHDLDEDGVLDGPTPNLGVVHALASAAQLDQPGVRLSSVTEVVYQRVRYFLQALYGDSFVSGSCDSWASFTLRSNLAGDPTIDNEDALAFDPLIHWGATFRAYDPRFTTFVSDLVTGLPHITEQAFDLSREEIHFETLTGGNGGVDLVGNLAYVCRGGGGLDIWDVTEPDAPTLLGNYDTPGSARQVQVVGTLAYVADDVGGLQIIDVSVSNAPTLAGSAPTAGPAGDVHVVGTKAYLTSADMVPMLHVVDVTTAATASTLADFPVADWPAGVRVQGNLAYLMESDQIEIVDVSDPTLPTSEDTVPTDLYARMDLAMGHLFVSSPTRLEVFSLATPLSPESVATLPLPGFSNTRIRVRGTHALLGRGFDGLCVVDVEDPSDPSLLGLIPTSGTVADVDQEGSLYVVTEGNGGLSTVGAGTPGPSGVVATVPLGGSADAVATFGSRVYLATSGPNELVGLDISNPLAPSIEGSTPLASHLAEDIAVIGILAFVAENDGLQVYDVSNPAAPVFLDGDNTFDGLQGVAVGSNVVYAAAITKLAVYDISTPASTTLLTSLPASNVAWGLAYDGSSIVLASGYAGIATFDATTPTAPTASGTLALSQALDVAVLPPFAYVTQLDGSGVDDRLAVVDYSVLNSPTSPSHVTLPGVDRVSRAGTLAYVSSRFLGVHVVDIAVPTAPVHVGSIPVPGNIADLDVEGGFVYVADAYPDGSLMVLRAAQVAVP